MKIKKRCQQILSVVLTVILAVQIPIVAYGQSMNDEALSNDLSFIEPRLEEQIVEEAEILEIGIRELIEYVSLVS